jgi:hypothetical protein
MSAKKRARRDRKRAETRITPEKGRKKVVAFCECEECGKPMSEREAYESGLFQLIEQAMGVAAHLHQLDEAHLEELEIIFDNLEHARHMVAAHVMGIEECDGESSAVNQ